MKDVKLIFILALILVFFSILLNAKWVKTYGGDGKDHANSIMQTKDGGYIIAGDTDSYGFPDQHCWIIKTSSYGDIEWQRAYTFDSANSIQQTSDEGFVFISGNISFKLLPNGDIDWQREYRIEEWAGIEHSGQLTHSYIQQTEDRGYIISGDYRPWWGNSYDGVVMKLSSLGDVEWKFAFGGYSVERLKSIFQTSDGGYVIAGETESFGNNHIAGVILKLSSNGKIEWQRIYEIGWRDAIESIQQTENGGYIVTGWTYLEQGQGISCFIIRLSSIGNIEWSRVIDGRAGKSIKQTKDKGFIIAGTIEYGWYDKIWISKLNTDGTIAWQRAYGTDLGNFAKAIVQTEEGGFIIACETRSSLPSEPLNDDILLMKISANGDIDPSCGSFLRTSDAVSSTVTISAREVNVEPRIIHIVPQLSNIYAQDTNAEINLICRLEPPQSFSNLSPPNGSTNKSVNVNLDWSDSAGASAYDIYKGTTFPLQKVATVIESNYEPGILENNTTYYWKIMAKNVGGETAGPEWSFTTEITSLAIQGSIKNTIGEKIANVQITFTNPGGTVETDSEGYYSYPVSYDWMGTATPYKAGYAFSPTMRPYSEVRSDLVDQDYTGAEIPFAPLNFSGKKEINRSLYQVEYINALSWQPNLGNQNIMKYRIYYIEKNSSAKEVENLSTGRFKIMADRKDRFKNRDAQMQLLIELNANTKEYWHRNVEKNKEYIYFLVAVDDQSREGEAAYVSIK